ncbi:MAG: type II secretion system F family protein [Anaerovibrio sp.]|uniref:type II secretion system F family protein n=1 Tax=Anaerovibrio sp. TaxID=1872532 RepID=UPI0025FB5703|nr:type II secretion system F family protein [Anaerovibrio sp.]MCR5177125.1 type II secretion system F family protein [Anaerovibrio sp.]
MFITFLFAVSVSCLLFLIFLWLIAKYLLPKATLKQRLNSLNTLNTVDASRMNNLLLRKTEASPKDTPLYERTVKPWLNSVENFFYHFTPEAIKNEIEHHLILAGKSHLLSPGAFSAISFIFMGLGIFLAYNYTSSNNNLVMLQKVAFTFIGGAAGSAMPFIILNIMAEKRKKLMLQQLPDFLDLMCVSVQAGLTFEAAIKKIIQRMTGPLIDEFRQTMDDMRMGTPRRFALKNMTLRCELPELSLFITSIIQSERLGTSISNTLTIQAENMRERRRQSIKALALKAPIKMLFPLIFFIFPALFVVVLLPAILTLMKQF